MNNRSFKGTANLNLYKRLSLIYVHWLYFKEADWMKSEDSDHAYVN